MLPGIASLASNQKASAALVDQNQFPQFSSSIYAPPQQLVPRKNVFDARQSFPPHGRPAKLVAQQQPQQPKPFIEPHARQASPLRYDIRTIHDPNYKVYNPEEDEEKNNLAALNKKPAETVYFQPYVSVEVNHPSEYRKEDLTENFDGEQNYKKNPYLAGPARYRRYTGGRSRENLKKAQEDDEDDPYNYKAEYISRPKAFDESPYSSPYTQKKGSGNKYEYPYSYDSGYDHKEYERIKELSEKQAAEIKQNPGNCKEVKRDDMSCMVCKDPKTGGNYESCSYVAEPKNNKYAYSKERKYDSNDDPEEPEQKSESPKKSEKLQASKEDTAPQKYSKTENEKPYSSYKQAESKEKPYSSYKQADSNEKPYSSYKQGDSSEKPYSSYKQADSSEKPYSSYKQADSKEKPYSSYKEAGSNEKPYSSYKQANSDDANGKYKGYYSSQPKSSEAIRAASNEESSEEVAPKAYDYKKALPGFYTDTEPKKDVEHVLAEFKKKDRSACKKVKKNGMTCYQCLDKNGQKNEECMFVSESAPKQSHLAYHEHKAFTSKPATLDGGGSEEAESQTVTTSSPPAQKSAEYAAASTNYNKKLKRKKAQSTAAATNPASKITSKVKRSEGSQAEDDGAPVGVSNLAPPEEFAGADSRGAFWAETLPRYSAALGVSLPEFMLSRSEHEASFDEAVAGA